MIKMDYVYLVLDYNAWADRSMVKTAKSLPEQVLHADQSIGFGRIFDTLVHMMDSQRVWLLRWQGNSSVQFSTRADYENLDQLETAWEPIRANFHRFIAESSLECLITYTTTRGECYTHPLGLLLWHALNHAVEHRSELAAMFTRSGFQHERVDLVYYLGTVAKLDR